MLCGTAMLAMVVGLPILNANAGLADQGTVRTEVTPLPSATGGLTVQGTASAKIEQQFQIGEASVLTFGTFARPTFTGTAELSPIEGLLHCNLTSIGRDKSEPATIRIGAVPGQTFGIAVGKAARIGGNSANLEVSLFEHDAGATPVVDASGGLVINIGASLYVAKGTPNGLYKGNFDIIVSNN